MRMRRICKAGKLLCSVCSHVVGVFITIGKQTTNHAKQCGASTTTQANAFVIYLSFV